MRALYDILPEHKRGGWAETSAEVLPDLRAQMQQGDVVLAKGSLSMKLGQIVDAIRKMGHPTQTEN
jgi:UDP-N-acetylmuramoyl-tripeptide--D-alanyl-D-alanine ligase